ncbi:MAG: carbohydrate kinase family protein [Planctomycetes bacterium]|nr:carbohydrate kinase family protein [Planctomycetota bacterium]
MKQKDGVDAQIAVAGHICLDIYIDVGRMPLETLSKGLQPGQLVKIGGARVATGGAVSNTGLSLKRLGLDVALISRVGDDMFGQTVAMVVEQFGKGISRDLRPIEGEPTSYSLVINPAERDRSFLHCPGVNDTFLSRDVDFDELPSLRLLHFGYPPLMRTMWINNGAELVDLFGRARRRGVTTSLDMAWPDPASEAGKADWKAILAAVGPLTDVFLPSIEEALYMVDPATYAKFSSGALAVDAQLLDWLSGELLGIGAAVVGVKLGADGMYIRTTDDEKRLNAMGACRPGDVANWRGRRLVSPCFDIKVANTTGAGDSTIAGFLAAMVKGLPIEAAANAACATGACNCQGAHAVHSVPSWDELQRRLGEGWGRRPVSISLPGWRPDGATGLIVPAK